MKIQINEHQTVTMTARRKTYLGELGGYWVHCFRTAYGSRLNKWKWYFHVLSSAEALELAEKRLAKEGIPRSNL